jgi:alkylhydroperoxidase family enzyme
MSMTPRLDPFAASPAFMKKWTAMSMDAATGLESSLIELVKIRSSQINSCANRQTGVVPAGTKPRRGWSS